MSKLGQTLRSYIWWTSPRGSFQYDVMVTLILLFIFLAPLWINFRDKPVEHAPNQAEIVIQSIGDNQFVYRVNARAVSATSPADIRDDLARAIESVAGDITIDKFEPVVDANSKKVIEYKVWGHR